MIVKFTCLFAIICFLLSFFFFFVFLGFVFVCPLFALCFSYISPLFYLCFLFMSLIRSLFSFFSLKALESNYSEKNAKVCGYQRIYQEIGGLISIWFQISFVYPQWIAHTKWVILRLLQNGILWVIFVVRLPCEKLQGPFQFWMASHFVEKNAGTHK